MPTPLERRLLRAALQYLQRRQRSDPSLIFRKRHGSPLGITGDPDITGLWNGHHFEIELKSPTASPSPLQAARLAEWKSAGALTFVCHSLPEFLLALSQIQLATSQKCIQPDPVTQLTTEL